MSKGILQEMTADDVRDLQPEVVVVPISSTEPHGPHLPFGTDYYTCDGVCRAAVEKANASGGRVLMYPTLPIGNNVNFKAFPFACRIGVRTLMQVLLDIIRALEEDGIRKIIIVNFHGGNPDTIRAALRENFSCRSADQQQDMAFVCHINALSLTSPDVNAQVKNDSAHAGVGETINMLHLKPDLVRKDKLGDLPVYEPTVAGLADGKAFFVKPWHLYMPNAAGGPTEHATAELGRARVESGIEGLSALLLDLSKSPWHPDFPYAPRSEND